MKDVIKRIAETIATVAKEEDAELNLIAEQGIFFMPELAFAYACGKAVMQNSAEIFGDTVPVWNRELDLKNGGPTDLVFQYENGKRIAIEFKMRDTDTAYLADIDKLSKLDEGCTARVFCALVDAFHGNKPEDGRITAVETYMGEKVASLFKDKPTFETNQDVYKNQVSCVVGVWAIGDIPTLIRMTERDLRV